MRRTAYCSECRVAVEVECDDGGRPLPLRWPVGWTWDTALGAHCPDHRPDYLPPVTTPDNPKAAPEDG